MALTCHDLLCEGRIGGPLFGGKRMALLEIEAGFWGLRRQMEALVGRQVTDTVLQQAGINGGAAFARALAVNVPLQKQAQALRDCLAAYQTAGFGSFTLEVVEWPPGRVVVRARDTFEAWATRQHGQISQAPVCAYSSGVLTGMVSAIAERSDIVCVEHECQAQGAAECRFELLPAAVAGVAPTIAVAPDPGLGWQLNLRELLFERMPMGIAILDRDLTLSRFNPTWAGFVKRYTLTPMRLIAPGAAFFDVAPGSQPIVGPLFERALRGETVRMEALRLESGGIVSYWDAVVAPLSEQGQVVGIIIVATDVTGRQRAQEELRESQQALSILLSNLPGMAYRCRNDRNRTMEFVSEGCSDLTGYAPADLVGASQRSFAGLIHSDDRATVWENTQAALHEGRPFQLFYRIITATGVEKWVWEQSRGVYASDKRLIAIEGFITDITERTIAYKTMEQRVKERTREIERRRQVAESLRDMLAILNSNRPLDEILDHIIGQAVQLLGADAGAIFRFHAEQGLLTIRAAQGLPSEYVATMTMPFGHGAVGRAVLELQPMVVTDIATILTEELRCDPQRRANLDWLADHFPGLIAVPLSVKSNVYGSLVLYFHEPHDLPDEEIGLIVAFSDQAALAIETARLRAQAEQAAVAAERNRLARDLHDSVTQTLFSASLIADVLPKLWITRPDEAQRRLEELRQLTRGALAEMRTLLLELRPTALTEAGLDELLRQLAEAIIGRARIPVSLHIIGQPELPSDVQVALYRIAQEALNNVAKHATATQATVHLRCLPRAVELRIRDDGCGFRRETISPEHLGINIMHERAEDIGAELTIESQPGYGTQVAVFWSRPEGALPGESHRPRTLMNNMTADML